MSLDVVVLGGGPAGAATALALRQRGYSVIVIERSNYEDLRIGETLPPSVRPVLDSLGVWERFLSEKHSPSFGNHSVWGRADVYDNDFIFSPYGPGWHVDRRRFDAMLARCAEEAGASVYRGARLINCTQDDGDQWRIEIAYDDQRCSFRTKFLVDATGRASAVARQKGVKRISYDRLIGVVAFFLPGSPEPIADSFTLVEAVEPGWWYSAVLPDSRLALAYMTDGDLYGRANKRSTGYWLQQLQNAVHTRSRAKPYAATSVRSAFAASSVRLDHMSGRGWLAVGDAAIAFDPLASQGVCKALQSGLRAAQSLQEYWEGDDTALLRYTVQTNQSFDDYLRVRNTHYCREKRWPASVFWQRRQAEPEPGVAVNGTASWQENASVRRKTPSRSTT